MARYVVSPNADDWPDEIVEQLVRQARAAAACEALRRRETIAILESLAEADLTPVLFKGAPLAYSLYAEPHLRPHEDTDLMIPRRHLNLVRRVLEDVGYEAPVYCEGELLFRQIGLSKIDAHGVAHAFDIHWQCSTQALFADMLTYEELAAEAQAVPMLGPHARSAGRVHALLLACVHPVMHHRAVERLVWTLDVHLLFQTLSPADLERFAALARARGVSAICRRALETSARLFQTVVPEEIRSLGADASSEPTAEYLNTSRRWHDDFRSNVRALDRWSDRARLVREVLFPAPEYMRRSYGWDEGLIASVLLPALYVHRGARGAWNVLRRRK
jgi:hypothetical protein